MALSVVATFYTDGSLFFPQGCVSFFLPGPKFCLSGKGVAVLCEASMALILFCVALFCGQSCCMGMSWYKVTSDSVCAAWAAAVTAMAHRNWRNDAKKAAPRGGSERQRTGEFKAAR